MPTNKKQHYVPAGYLQFFAADGDINGRDSLLWVTEGTKTFKDKAARLAKGDYTYSKDVDRESSQHKELEDDYPNNVRAVLAGNDGPRIQMQMLLFILNLHFRNARYELPQNKERLDLYDMWQNQIFRTDICDEFEYKDLQELADHLWSKWGTACIDSDEPLITSDNPAIIFSDGEHDIAYMFLSMTPHKLLVCFRREWIEPNGVDISTEEAGRLNGVIASQSIGQVYSHDEWDEKDLRKSGELRTKYKKTPSMGEKSLEPAFITYSRDWEFMSRNS